MRVLLDECLPFDLVPLLLGHEVVPVVKMGWAGVKNGALLRLAAGEFAAFITIDKRLHEQQAIPPSLAVVTLGSRSNRISDLRPLVPGLLSALTNVQPGTVARVGI